MQDIISVFGDFFWVLWQLVKKAGHVLLFSVFFSAVAGSVAAQSPARIAIVIDDLGNQPTLDARFIQLSGPVALAFLPDAPATPRLARAAHQAGKPVLLHLPMAGSDPMHVEPNTLHVGMSRRQLITFVRRAITRVPFLEGLNNHQGSQLTASQQLMDWLMTELSAYPGLYFIDSRTTAETRAEQLAWQHGIPVARRRVFLDNNESPQAIATQLQQLAVIARREGHAIAIGHPNPATLAVLRNLPDWLQAENLQLVSPAQLVRQNHNRHNTPAHQQTEQPLVANRRTDTSHAGK